MRRALTVLMLAAGAVILTAPAASAHALKRSSAPADGAELAEAPGVVSVTFTEEPEVSLSSLRVLDASGASFESGEATAVPGDALTLRAPVRDLPEGVYSIVWRVVSRVDGHATGGVIAFGIRVDPSTVPAAEVKDEVPRAGPVEVAGRWGLFAGLGIVLGAVWLGLIAPEGFGGRGPTAFGAALAVAGLIALAVAQRSAADVGLGTLLGTVIGRALVLRAIGLAAVGVGAAIGGRRGALLAGAGAAATLWVHVSAGHAGTGSDHWLKTVAQWVHVMAASVWLGGLAVLVRRLRGATPAARARAASRFSIAAGVALFVVLATGTARSFSELPEWRALWTSTYGIAIAIKAGLLGVLAVLGAVNRYRMLPKVGESATGLLRVGRAEVAIAAVVLAAAGVLASSSPPLSAAEAAAAAAEGPITVEGTDFGTTVRVALEVSPGRVGANGFSVRVEDYDTGEPVDAQRVSILLRYLDAPGVAEVPLTLERVAGSDRWETTAPALSLAGRWSATVLVQGVTGSAEVRLEIATRCGAQALPVEGGPTLFDVALPGGVSGQGYVDPAETGFNEVHVTYFGPDGIELSVEDTPVMSATPSEGDSLDDLVVRRLSDGHFIGDAQLTPGAWRFDVGVEGPEGDLLRLCFNEVIEE